MVDYLHNMFETMIQYLVPEKVKLVLLIRALTFQNKTYIAFPEHHT